MPILEIQSRMYERGRIRIGQQVAGRNGKMRPEKLDRFRFTSAARENLLPIAAAYGGEVVDWTPADGRKQYEVVTNATRIPILLPPNPVSQWLELWSGGGCQRRCDGIREVINDSPCMCAPDPEDRECKPTTRLNVVLRDMPGIGVWRLESHGWNAAVELPGLAAFVAAADGMVPAFLTLEERIVKSGGETRKFMVPGIDVDITPSQLLAGQQPGQSGIAGGGEQPALTGGQVPDYVALATAAPDLDAVRVLWKQAKDAGHLTDELATRLMEIGNSKVTPAEGPPPSDSAGDESADEVWMLIVAAAPDGWGTSDLLADFEATHGLPPSEATVEQLRSYLQQIKSGAPA